jgi:cytochrome P450
MALTVTDRPSSRALGRDVLRLLLTTTYRADPYPLYQRLREHQPVHRTPFGLWLVTGYHDAAAALRDRRLSSEVGDIIANPAATTGAGGSLHQLAALARYAGVGVVALTPTLARVGAAASHPERGPADFGAVVAKTLLLRDPPDHTRLRRLVSRAFTARVIDTLTPRINQLVAELLDKATAGRTCDLIADVARPLPLTIICELLGIPTTDQHRLIGWSQQLVVGLDTLQTLLDRRAGARADRATVELARYLDTLVRRRRADPADDLISRLAQARDGDDQLADTEIVAMCALLVIAGHETTVNLIGNGLVALLRNPDACDRWRAEPQLAATAVEELLRYDGPVQSVFRRATRPVDIGGQQIPAGDIVLILVGSANRDPDAFIDPNELVLDRDPNHHLALGSGLHYCLGAPLARAEARIALPAILQHQPRLLDTPRWRPTFAIRGLQHLPVTLTRHP